ncbi:MAG: hypothetical protein JG776_2186 [Caloramator sp.]|jgi:hypothetical protein|uniref:hypothetical protein n=1 Tax=Caloramator sp. TaxID=1871330 RepID=UPI001D8B67AB|nr:hypothetical protein [Caloramator sp.]MBZ4664468.1 hypothetical protein [Caloramator sp.]
MSKIIDLSVLVKDPLIFKDTQGESYTIPGEISTQFVIKLSKYAADIQKIKDEAVALEKMQQIVTDILSLDKSKNITIDFVKERFDDIRFLKIIISEMMKHVKEIAEDPNSNSLESN